MIFSGLSFILKSQLVCQLPHIGLLIILCSWAWSCQASGVHTSLRVHACIHDGVSHWIKGSAERSSVHIISVLLPVEIYLGGGPTSHPSLGHNDAYKAIIFCMIQPECWHGCSTAFRGSCQAGAVHLLHHLPVT